MNPRTINFNLFFLYCVKKRKQEKVFRSLKSPIIYHELFIESDRARELFFVVKIPLLPTPPSISLQSSIFFLSIFSRFWLFLIAARHDLFIFTGETLGTHAVVNSCTLIIHILPLFDFSLTTAQGKSFRNFFCFIIAVSRNYLSFF